MYDLPDHAATLHGDLPINGVICSQHFSCQWLNMPTRSQGSWSISGCVCHYRGKSTPK
jgi:hypothetical protein